MKTTIRFFIFLSLAVCMTLIDSCSKNDMIRGCMDPDSKNYDSKAEEDDGRCLYEGSVVFWYDMAASNGLVYDGAISLTFYLNGVIIGTSPAAIYWTGAPDCGQTGTISVKQDLGSFKTLAYELSVKDQTGFEYWTSTININGNTCTQFKLQWSTSKKRLNY